MSEPVTLAMQALIRQGRADAMREAIAAVQAVYDLQCPPDPDVEYVEGQTGARWAHQWWSTVLGGTLRDLRYRADALERGES